jgi:hypothetical protein
MKTATSGSGLLFCDSKTADLDVQRSTCATGICQGICKAHVIDKTFRVNRAFSAELLDAATCGHDGF